MGSMTEGSISKATIDRTFAVENLAEFATEHLLMSVPDAHVHLIFDHEDPFQVASGSFDIFEIIAKENAILAFICVGKDLRWPLSTDEYIVRLAERRFLFTMKVAADVCASGSPSSQEEQNEEENMLSYGVTFPDSISLDTMHALEEVLKQYSQFVGLEYTQKPIQTGPPLSIYHFQPNPVEIKSKSFNSVLPGASTSFTAKEEECYWSNISPAVNEYKSSIARGVLVGSEKLAKGIQIAGFAASRRLDRIASSNRLITDGEVPKTSDCKNSSTTKTLKIARKVSKMTAKVADSVLSEVVTVTGDVTAKAVKYSGIGSSSKNPETAEVVIASLDAFEKICDAAETAGKCVLKSSSNATSCVVTSRYGEERGKQASHGLATIGHVMRIAWCASKFKRAYIPSVKLVSNQIAENAMNGCKKKGKCSGQM